ncbi:hypothetical protein BVX95_01545 [archaeon D22]|nr:hypothetical protein BVX95_01545 [archaeon D22]
MLIDVHAHLDHDLMILDLDEIIERAKKNGVKAIITNGINKDTNRLSLELANKYDIVKAALGIYPIDALDRESSDGGFKIEPFDVDAELKFMEENSDKFVAFGEVGLDLYNGKDIKMQKEVLGKIIKLAIKLDKPIILHSRKAERELMEFLSEFPGLKPKRVIMHCFSGRKHLIKEAIERGYSFSIPTNIVKSDHFQRLVEWAPLKQILTETDAPYLSPYPDERNEPSYVNETIKKIAEIKEMDETEVMNNIYMNYQKIF